MNDSLDELYTSQAYLIDKLCKDLNRQVESVAIEGLKRKGFEFENRFELEQFVKNNCTCEHFIDSNEKVYYVNDIPFLLHKYEFKISSPFNVNDRTTKIVGSLGHYKFL